jgi:hypothetical protein
VGTGDTGGVGGGDFLPNNRFSNPGRSSSCPFVEPDFVNDERIRRSRSCSFAFSFSESGIVSFNAGVNGSVLRGFAFGASPGFGDSDVRVDSTAFGAALLGTAFPDVSVPRGTLSKRSMSVKVSPVLASFTSER